MAKEVVSPRFGPGRWVTMRDTGENVKVEMWSSIAAAYRVRSKKKGLQIVTDDEVDDLVAHPDAERGKHWHLCPAPACGAPLTPNLTTCPRCEGPTCTCGRCRCVRAASTSPRPRVKAALKAVAARA